MTNLLKQMKEVKNRISLRREYPLDERAQVVLAWLNNEITFTQFSRIINPGKRASSSKLSSFITYTIKDMYQNKMITIKKNTGTVMNG